MTFQTRQCNIAVVPQNEKDAALSDCDSDRSDMDYEWETGHLPAKLLNAHSEVMQTDHEWDNLDSFEDLPSPIHNPPSPSCPHNNEGPMASSCKKGQSKEPRAKLKVVKNKDRVFKRPRKPATAIIPEHKVYRPNTAEFIKQSCPNPTNVFLLMYPHTLRELTVGISNLYSTQR